MLHALHRPPRLAFYLAVVLALGALIITRPSIRGNDGVQNYAYLRSMLVQGNLDFTDEYTHYLELQPRWFDHRELPRDPVTNLPMNLYGVGSALLWAPYVAVVHGALLLFQPTQADGFSPPYEWAVGYATALHTVLGLYLLWGLLARIAGRIAALAAIMTLWLGTPLFFYGHLHPSMSHGNSFLMAVVLCRLMASRGVAQGGVGAWAAMGAAAGMLILVRFQDGILILAPIVAEALRLWGSGSSLGERMSWLRRRLWAYSACVLCGLAVLSIQGAAWSILQGGWLTGPRAYVMQGSFRLASPWILQTWFSPWHGLFHWHPILMVGLVGLFVARRGLGPRVVAVVGFLAASYVIGCWSIWHGGASFGHRMYISALPALGLGLCFGYRSLLGPWRQPRLVVAGVVVAAAVVWNFGLVFQYATEMIPRNKPVWITTMAWNSAMEIPLRVLGIKSAFGGNSPVEPPVSRPDSQPTPSIR